MSDSHVGGGNDSRQVSIIDQLVAAIQEGDLVNLRTLLSQKKGRRCVVTDDDIHEALYAAAEVGSVVACRLLWERLSRRGKQTYFAARNNGYCPLHEAAENDHLQVVQFFIEECNFNVNQKNSHRYTPLNCATDSEEMTGYLLEHGADVNIEFSPLKSAVEKGNTGVVRLLFQYGADPNRGHLPVHAGLAIRIGNDEILSMLLVHGAIVLPSGNDDGPTLLNKLLQRYDVEHETKLSIGRILVEHARVDTATATFMHMSLEYAIKLARNDCCEILLEAGMNPSSCWALDCAIQAGNEPVCRLLVQYGSDPFSEEGHENEDEEHAASPFLAAARLPDTSIFEYFLGLWNERFASTGGKNDNGDYPLHVVCCDPSVSLQAIKMLVDRHADILATVDGEQGLLPFHFAANWGASLDVIFYLLQHCPDALFHCGNAAAVGQCPLSTAGDASGSTLESTCNDDDSQACGTVQKKSKTA